MHDPTELREASRHACRCSSVSVSNPVPPAPMNQTGTAALTGTPRHSAGGQREEQLGGLGLLVAGALDRHARQPDDSANASASFWQPVAGQLLVCASHRLATARLTMTVSRRNR